MFLSSCCSWRCKTHDLRRVGRFEEEREEGREEGEEEEEEGEGEGNQDL